ncbi:helix-turn-helix domain-containing protein [Paenibacillus sp. YIM B09110]|uniref:helix-turn-helix domain-containing protein n=1 Tax=Paenibacillus sp. YIM B09110 TaxID=3126102 RepID=UPI00301B7A5A
MSKLVIREYIDVMANDKQDEVIYLSRIAQTVRVVQLMLDMLDASEQQLALQLNTEHGQRMDVARLYSDKDVAERYGVHVRTARDWISSGRIRGFRMDRRWYSRADWLDEYEGQMAVELE